MRAIGKHIIIQPVQAEAKTKSGILLSADDTEQLRYKRGCCGGGLRGLSYKEGG